VGKNKKVVTHQNKQKTQRGLKKGKVEEKSGRLHNIP